MSDVGRDDEDTGTDHRADHDHGRIEEAEAFYQFVVLGRYLRHVVAALERRLAAWRSRSFRDGEKRLARRGAGRADEIETDDRVGILLCRRREDRAYGYIVRRSAVGLPQLVEIVCRNAYPACGTDDFAGVVGGQVFLADVDAAA